MAHAAKCKARSAHGDANLSGDRAECSPGIVIDRTSFATWAATEIPMSGNLNDGEYFDGESLHFSRDMLSPLSVNMRANLRVRITTGAWSHT